MPHFDFGPPFFLRAALERMKEYHCPGLTMTTVYPNVYSSCCILKLVDLILCEWAFNKYVHRWQFNGKFSITRLNPANCARVYSTRVMDLARSCHYIVSSNRFFTDLHLYIQCTLFQNAKADAMKRPFSFVIILHILSVGWTNYFFHPPAELRNLLSHSIFSDTFL